MTITPQPGIMDIALYVGGQSRLEGHASPLKLSSNENPHGTSTRALAALERSAATLHRYPSTDHAELRAAIAEGNVPVAAEKPFVQAMGDEEEYDEDYDEDDEDIGEEATTNFAYGIAALRDYADVVVAEGFANPLKVRRAVQEMIDLSVQDFDASLKLHTIQGADDPYFNHSLNVANLAIAVGQKLGEYTPPWEWAD